MPTVAKWYVNARVPVSKAPSSIPSISRRKRVLVVDDEPGAIPLLRKLLSRHEVVTTESAEVAVRLLDLGRFDIVIVDNWTRQLSGLELLSYVSARHPRTRRILHSAQEPGTFRNLQDMGVVEFYVAKPGYFMLERLCDGFGVRRRVTQRYAVAGQPA